MNERGYTFGESAVFGVSSGIGFYLAIVCMAAIRFKLIYSNIPDGLKGLGITMILTGLLSMAYLSFSGIQSELYLQQFHNIIERLDKYII